MRLERMLQIRHAMQPASFVAAAIYCLRGRRFLCAGLAVLVSGQGNVRQRSRLDYTSWPREVGGP